VTAESRPDEPAAETPPATRGPGGPVPGRGGATLGPSPAAPDVHRIALDPRLAADWTGRQTAETNLRALVGRASPRVRGMFREKSWLAFEILLPFLGTSAYVLVYRALKAPEDYVGFVVLGGALSAFWLNVVWSMAGQLYWEKSQGNLELYFAAPMSLMSVLLGMAAGGLLMSASRAAAVLVISSVVYGVQFHVEAWPLVVAVFTLTLTALYGLGMMLASLFLLWGREAWHLTNVLVEPVYFVSGLNFPVGRLGALGAAAIATVPFAVGLDAMRQLAFPASTLLVGTPTPGVEALILVAMTVVFTIASRWCMAAIERMARARGSLSIRWQ
jgi:ABC-2 type transport system permease protein